MTKLDRLARSLPDARAIADELTTRQISLSLGGSVYDPTDAVGRLLFNVLAMVAEFESDLIRLRTREGMKVAKAKGRLRGKQPKLNRRQEAHLVSLVHSGEYSTLEVAELFGVGRSTVYRAIERQRVEAKANSRRRRRGTDGSPRRRLSRIRHPAGPSAPSAFRRAVHVRSRLVLRETARNRAPGLRLGLGAMRVNRRTAHRSTPTAPVVRSTDQTLQSSVVAAQRDQEESARCVRTCRDPLNRGDPELPGSVRAPGTRTTGRGSLAK